MASCGHKQLEMHQLSSEPCSAAKAVESVSNFLAGCGQLQVKPPPSSAHFCLRTASTGQPSSEVGGPRDFAPTHVLWSMLHAYSLQAKLRWHDAHGMAWALVSDARKLSRQSRRVEYMLNCSTCYGPVAYGKVHTRTTCRPMERTAHRSRANR